MRKNETINNIVVKFIKSLTTGVTCEQVVDYVKCVDPNIKPNDVRKCVENLNNNPKIRKQFGYIYWID